MNKYVFSSFNYLFIGLLALVLFGTLTFALGAELAWLEAFDKFGTTFFNVSKTDTFTIIVKQLTEIGNIRLIIALTIILCIILFVKRYYTAGLWLGGTILFGAAVTTKFLKQYFDRPRPDVQQIIEKTSESFPSGHATGTTVFFTLLIIACILFLQNTKKQKIYITSFALVILFVLFSRIYLGVHYPTDVIGGFLLGVSAACISTSLYLSLEPYLSRFLKKIKLKNRSFVIQKEKMRASQKSS